MNDLQAVYPKPVMDDISTSYCFICLLHLANEQGLKIDNAGGQVDDEVQRGVGELGMLTVFRDPNATRSA